ncbi:recombinase family protein [Micromonospora parva]|uniref:recombinase family protein n=1 Tax=Micromonospora parva TaxID=1464048 RepID=UPI0036629A28
MPGSGSGREILANPRYTGRQVWNRQPAHNGTDASRPEREPIRRNPTADWVVSTQRSHSALVSEQDFVAVQAVRSHRSTHHGTTCRYLVRALPVGSVSQMTEPRRAPASPPQRFTSSCSTPTGVTFGDPRHRPAPAAREQRRLTTSTSTGRSRGTARPHQHRSKPSPLSGIGEHFGRGDLFADLHPTCSQLQGQAYQRLLTALTCAHSLPGDTERRRLLRRTAEHSAGNRTPHGL